MTPQASFVYDDSETPVIPQANVVLHLPQLEPVDNTDTKSSSLVTTGYSELSFHQLLSSKSYRVDVPITSLFGPNYGSILLDYLKPSIATTGAPSLADVSIPFSVSYVGNSSTESAYETLFFFKADNLIRPAAQTFPPLPRFRSTKTIDMPNGAVSGGGLIGQVGKVTLNHDSTITSTAPVEEAPSQPEKGSFLLNSIVDANLYWINKSAYMSCLKQLFPETQGSTQAVLLYVINSLIDISRPTPILSQGDPTARQEAFNQIISNFNVKVPDGALENIIKLFPTFFDLPLEEPKLKLLTLAGDLHINIPSPQKLTPADFAYYHLSASFFIQDGSSEQEPQQCISRFEWISSSVYGDNFVKFSVQDKYTTSSLVSPVTVNVTGFDNSELFAADFNASDPALQNLNILVNLSSPPVMTGSSPTGGTQPANKKSRVK